jgi:hypothetical protein
MKWLMALAIILIALAEITTGVRADNGTGSVVLQIQGYGTVHGQLENATIQGDNSVSMLLIVNDTLQTSQGSFPLEASGTLNGVRSNSTLSGTINDIHGKIDVCVLFACNNVYFNGQGNWTGLLDTSSTGAGNLAAVVTITNSPYSQMPQGQSIPTDGSWTANFASPVPEFNSNGGLLVLALSSASLVLTRKSKRKRPN